MVRKCWGGWDLSVMDVEKPSKKWEMDILMQYSSIISKTSMVILLTTVVQSQSQKLWNFAVRGIHLNTNRLSQSR